MFNIHLDHISLILLSILTFFVLVQLVYHFTVYGKLLRKMDFTLQNKDWQKVSIIICARSEFENLQQLVPILQNQDYPEFEVIIVDDASWDGTTSYLEELCKTDARFKAVYVTDDMKKNYLGKKLALSLGIKAAKNDILLLIDADCIPASPLWIKYMVEAHHTQEECEIVLGYSPVYPLNTFSNLIARMDNLYTATSYFSYAIGKDPYMGVGRNLSYKRSLFFKLKGFASHLHIAPGDDDLFIQEAANAKNTAIALHPDSFVFTHSKKSFGAWFSQKKRHNFAGKYYKLKHRFKLGWMMMTHMLLWLAFIANAFYIQSFGWAICLIALYWLIKWPLIYKVFKQFKQGVTSIWMPIFDVLYVFYNFTFGMISVFGKQKKW